MLCKYKIYSELSLGRNLPKTENFTFQVDKSSEYLPEWADNGLIKRLG